MSDRSPKRRPARRFLVRRPGLLGRERGAIAVEYMVIMVLVAIVGIASWNRFGDAVREDVRDQHVTFGYPGAP